MESGLLTHVREETCQMHRWSIFGEEIEAKEDDDVDEEKYDDDEGD